METKPLYVALALLLVARENCKKSGNVDWLARHTDTIRDLVKEHMPRGSGFDSGTQIDLDRSTPDKLVFQADFHHMDGNGYYCGWAEHTVTVRPSLAFGIDIRISGRDHDGFKDYAHELFSDALGQQVDPYFNAKAAA